MSSLTLRTLRLSVPSLMALAAGMGHAAESDDFFETKVRPVLAKNCYGCHTDSQMGGLRLDSAEGVKKGGKSGEWTAP